jgi:hypothetical protein
MYCLPKPLGARLALLRQVVFPNAQDAPTDAAESSSDRSVTGAITNDFRVPIPPIRGWATIASWAPVPEAPVNEDGQTLFAEDEIGLAGQVDMPPPACDAGKPEDRQEPQLGVRVPLRAYSRHNLATLGLCEDVRHEDSTSSGRLKQFVCQAR